MPMTFQSLRNWAGASSIAITAMVCSSGLHGQTLADAMVGAYNHTGLLQQNRALLRAADENVAQASAALLPVLNWTADAQRTLGDSSSEFGTTQLESTSISASLIASWQIYDFGADAANIESLRETVLATRAGLLALEQVILLQAVTTFMNVRATSETVAIQRSNIRLLREELRAAQDRFEVGEVTRTDVSLAEAALAASVSDLAAAEGAFRQAREAYRVAVGVYPGTLSSPPPLPKLEGSIERAQKFAVQNHPDMMEARHQVSAAELTITQTQLAQKPVISLNGSLSVSDELGESGGVENLTVGIGASGPIYQGGALDSIVRSAMAQRDAARGNLHVVRHDVFADVGNAYADLQAAFAQIDATEEQIRAARVAFEGIREEAKLGARTTLDVLDAEQQLLDAQASRVSAEASQYIAAYSVLSSMGLLTAERLKLPVQIYDASAYYNVVKDGGVTRRSKQGQQLDRVLRALNK